MNFHAQLNFAITFSPNVSKFNEFAKETSKDHCQIKVITECCNV